MKKKSQVYFSVCMIIAFAVWTILVNYVDVKTIGPNGTQVGFATLNIFMHRLTGVNMSLYNMTDWLGLVPFFFACGFGILGLIQWIKRKQILKVDFNILILGGFYIVTIAVYLFFELVVINYRPILINGVLEASYPSSTTMLTMCVIPTAIIQFNIRIKNTATRNVTSLILTAFTVFMVVARFISGVHWFTDIIGGIMFSIGLVALYSCFVNFKKEK